MVNQTCFLTRLFFTCDLHLKLQILNPFDSIFLPNNFLNESFALQFVLSKNLNFEIFL